MKTHLATFALSTVLVLGLSPGEIRAQSALPTGVTQLGAEMIVDPIPSAVSWPALPTSVGVLPAQIFPYSYDAAFPGPARVYAPYGENDIFPYSGRGYGHPYDRWSWSTLSGFPDSLNRYYYPPVR